MKIYSAQFKGTTTVSTGSNVSLTGSFSGSIYGFDDTIQYSSSVSSDLLNLESKSASVDISISNINQYTGSNDTKWTTLTNITSSLIAATGSYATTGSNSFYGTQVFSGSVFIANDLVVQGSSSIQYISASSVSIGTNIVQLNTANPSVRFAGLTIIDSGSVGGSGSFLYDSLQDEFIFVHRGNGTNITSSHFVLGPETYDNLGNEIYLSCNTLSKGTGKEHLIDSCIFDNGTTTCIKNNLVGTGTACFASSVTAATTLSIGGADQGYQLDVKKSSTGDSTFDTIANFYKASTNGTQLLIRAKNSLIDLAGSYVIGGGGPNTGLSFSVSPSACSPTEAMRIISDGTIGIGITTGTGKLFLKQSNACFYDGINVYASSNDAFTGIGNTGALAVVFSSYNTTAGAYSPLAFFTSDLERMRITSGGNVVIGNTNPFGGLTVSEFTANDCNDSISLFYRGTTGSHESLVKFYDFRCQINASIGNNLHDDTPGSPRARLVFKTSNGGSPIERLRITSEGCIMLCNNNLPLASISNFGYSGTYQVLILGNTNNGQTKSLAFGVDISGNNSGAFSGYGNEYIWRCAGSFITPNSANNGYNTLLGWNTTGCISFPNAICTPTISITSNPIGVEYLIIAGGGGGGWDVGGGGGAGGVLNDSTGIWPGTYNIGIGAGGAGKTGGGGVSTTQLGYNTYAIGLMAIGGGGGGNYSGGHGSAGGSGGGGAGYGSTTYAGFGMKGQGFEGGCGINVAGTSSTGGAGGGAGGVGPSSINSAGGSTNGGVGIISTIIGEHRSYGCGGRGGGDNWTGPMYNGTANTGGGGDGAGNPNEGCSGGSGIVILKMKNTNSATFSGGLTTYTCTNVACYNIYVVTAGAGTVTIS